MPDSLPQLEEEGSQILRRFTILGDLRPGSIYASTAAAKSQAASAARVGQECMVSSGQNGFCNP